MKTKSFAQKYIHMATKKPLFFYSFLFLGVALFLYLTLTTHIDTAEGSRTLFYMIFVRAGRGL